MKTIIAAAIQMRSTSDKEENYKSVADFVLKAADQKAQLIVLPEHWNWLGRSSDKVAAAEALAGPSIQFIQRLAKQHQCFFVAGSIAEAGGNKPPYNTSVTVHPDGSLGKAYRKIHLFDAQVALGHKESEHTSAGGEVVVEKLEFGGVGSAICYDVRFPELFRQMAGKGAEIFAIPSNFTAVTGPSHWEVLLRARAIENQCFVIAADQTGVTGTGWEAHGHSMVVGPWGEILAMAKKEEGVILAELNLEKLADIRNRMPAQTHRKL